MTRGPHPHRPTTGPALSASPPAVTPLFFTAKERRARRGHEGVRPSFVGTTGAGALRSLLSGTDFRQNSPRRHDENDGGRRVGDTRGKGLLLFTTKERRTRRGHEGFCVERASGPDIMRPENCPRGVGYPRFSPQRHDGKDGGRGFSDSWSKRPFCIDPKAGCRRHGQIAGSDGAYCHARAGRGVHGSPGTWTRTFGAGLRNLFDRGTEGDGRTLYPAGYLTDPLPRRRHQARLTPRSFGGEHGHRGSEVCGKACGYSRCASSYLFKVIKKAALPVNQFQFEAFEGRYSPHRYLKNPIATSMGLTLEIEVDRCEPSFSSCRRGKRSLDLTGSSWRQPLGVLGGEDKRSVNPAGGHGGGFDLQEGL